MKPGIVIVTGEGDGWHVRLDGVDVVSFLGPHAHEWALREREVLAHLLSAQRDSDRLDRYD
jgi:hypothetical protein